MKTHHPQMKTTQLYVQESTHVTDLAVLLFGGQLSITPSTQSSSPGAEPKAILSMKNGFMRWETDSNVAAHVHAVKEQIETLMVLKIEQPEMDLREESRHLVRLVSMILGMETRPVQLTAEEIQVAKKEQKARQKEAERKDKAERKAEMAEMTARRKQEKKGRKAAAAGRAQQKAEERALELDAAEEKANMEVVEEHGEVEEQGEGTSSLGTREDAEREEIVEVVALAARTDEGEAVQQEERGFVAGVQENLSTSEFGSNLGSGDRPALCHDGVEEQVSRGELAEVAVAGAETEEQAKPAAVTEQGQMGEREEGGYIGVAGETVEREDATAIINKQGEVVKQEDGFPGWGAR